MSHARDTLGTALFVGGPRDGQLTPAFTDDRAYCRVPVVQYSPPITAEYLATLPQAALPMVEYRREVVHTPQHTYYFWLAPGLTADDLMVRLMTSYHHWKERA